MIAEIHSAFLFLLQITPVCVRLLRLDVRLIKKTSHLSFNQLTCCNFSAVNHLLSLLLAVTGSVAVVPSHNLASERSSIESTYELTKYLEYQLKEIKDVYVSSLLKCDTAIQDERKFKIFIRFV